MRVSIFLAAAFIVFGATSVSAEVEMTVREAGRVKRTAKVENGILGISNSFTRSRGLARECVGAAFARQPHKPEFGYAAILISTSAHAVGPPANEKTSGPCRAIEIVEVMRLTTSSARLETNHRERDWVLVETSGTAIKNE